MDSNRRSENEDFPVRDASVNKIIRREMNGGSMKSALNRQAISKIDRVDLEEKYLTLYDENIVLKKYGRKRDEEIKRLCAIQARLENDRKKLMSDPSGKRPADAYYLQQIEQLNDKIFQLEKTNEALKMKLTVLKQQNVMSQTTLSTYPHIPSKVDTGVQKQYVDPRIIKNIRMIIRPNFSHGPKTPKASTVEASNQIDFLTQKNNNEFSMQRPELERLMTENRKMSEEYKRVIADLKEQIQIVENKHEAELSHLRSRLNEDQKNKVKENVDRIKLEREMKEKSIKFQQLHDQFAGFREKMSLMKRSNEQAVTEIEELQEDLKVERSKVANLQKQVESGKSNKMLLMEQQARVADLERECEILKESNCRLMSSALDVEKENQWKKREAAFRVQIGQLEAAMQADVGDKGNLLERMVRVKDELEKVRCELKECKAKNEGLLKKNEELTEKTSVFGEDGAFTNEQFTEALSIVKRRQQKEALVARGSELDFLQETDQNLPCNVDLDKRLMEAEAQQTETANELEKTRNLLMVQYKINNDYKNELEITNKKMEESKREFDAQLDKYAQLLDIRAERIRKLETQLKDVAYGTKQYRIDTEDRMAVYKEEEDDADVMLENGQNLFEVHIKSLMLTEDCLKILSDSNPSMFCTWEFYDFELQSTPILQGPRMDYQFTSQYVVQVDDFFIHYLQKDSCVLELHQCLGSDYRTLAVGRIRLNGLLERSSGRIHGTLNLIATEKYHEGTSVGVLEYWVRLRVPMEQALRLYKERTKALGYLESNAKQAPPITPLDQSAARRPPNNINHLTIHIKSCRNVKATSCEAKQPSCYVVYKFYDFPDHDTSIIHSSNDPFFDDKRTYPVAMTSQLESYLKTQVLKAYLFDDTDPNVDSYLGLVSIPLVTLSHDGKISGEFEVTDKDGNPNGSMEVLMTWKYSYLTPMRVQTPPTLQKPDQIQIKRKSQSCKSSLGDAKAPTPVADSPSEAPRIGSEFPDFKVERKSKSCKASSGDVKAPTPIVDDPSEPPERSHPSTSPRSERGSVSPGKDVEPGSPTMSIREQADENANQNAGKFGESDDDAEDRSQKGRSQRTTSPPSAPGHSQGLDTNENTGRTVTKQGSQSDDSDVVVPNKRPSQKTPEDTVTITISHVRLSQDSPLLKNAGVQKLYVAYEFFGEPPEQTETPFSLPKPTQPDKAISFNFTRTFSVGQEENMEKRYFLASMLMKEGVDGGRLRFTLISEPVDDEGDCEDVGVAFVSLPQILEEEKDVLEEDIPIHSSSTDTTVVGHMGVTVQCLETLRNIHREMQRTSMAE